MTKILYLLFTLLCCLTGYSQNLTGKWKLEADIQGLGAVQILLDFTKTSDTTFFASSRPKALKEVIGGLKYTQAN